MGDVDDAKLVLRDVVSPRLDWSERLDTIAGAAAAAAAVLPVCSRRLGGVGGGGVDGGVAGGASEGSAAGCRTKRTP